MNFSNVNQFAFIIIFALFPIVKTVDVTLLNNYTENGVIAEDNDGSLAYDSSEHFTEDDPMLLVGADYDEDLFFGKMYSRCVDGKCHKCEICVNNECLPHVVEAIYNQDCSLKDHCFNNTDCGEFECVFTYGDYFCRCPPGTYGKHCDEVWPISGRDVPFSDLQAVYPAAVAAGAPVTMMAMWKSKDRLSRDTKFIYRTDNGFAEELDVDPKYIKALSSPRTSCEDHELGDVCNNLPMELTYTRSFWRTEFPYLDFGGLSDSMKVHRVLPENRVVLGYKQTFTLSLFTKNSSSAITSNHEIFVYYSDTRLYFHKCFPKLITPNPPCVTRLSEESRLYSRVLKKNQLLIKAHVPVMEDSDCKQILLTYTIWRSKSFLQQKGPLYNITGDVVDLEPYLLKVGSYRVKITVVSKWGSGKSQARAVNFIRCWFEVWSTPLVAEITGGNTRTVYAYDDLVMDASPSKDPNSPPSRQTNLFFTWWCNETDYFCQNFTTKGRQYVIKAPLRVGVTYGFQLKVYAFQQEPAYDWQVVTTSPVKLASFFIQCSKNCHTLSNPDKVTYLQINVTNEDYPSGKFNWSYSSPKVLQPIPLVNAGMLTSKTSYDVAIIRGDFFEHGSNYTFYAKRNEPVGFAKMIIKTCQKPLFRCDISPKQGIQLITKFRIYCNINSSEPYNYTFYTNVENSYTLPLYIDVNTKGQLKDVVLYYRKIRVMAMADTGCFKIKHLSVKLTPLNSSVFGKEEIKSRVGWLKRNINDGVIQLWDPSYGGYLNMLVYLSLFAKKNKLEHVFKWDYVLGIIDKVVYKEPFDTKRFLSVLVHLSKLNSFRDIDDDFDNELLAITTHVFNMISYYRKYPTIWNNDLLVTAKEQKQIAKSFFNYITRVLDTLGKSQNSLLQDRLLSRDPEMHRGRLSRLLGRKDEPDRQGTESDLLSHKHFHLQNTLYKQMMDITRQTAASIKHFVMALCRRMLPMEPGIYFSTDNYTLYIRIDSPKYFMLYERIPLIKQVTSYIRIGRKLGEELQERSPYINLKVIILNQDPFWWDDDPTVVHSQILQPLIALHGRGRWRVHNTLPFPLDIFLKVKQIQSVRVSGTAQLPQDQETDSDKDLSVTIYRLSPPYHGGHGKLFLEFLIPAGKSLRVTLTHNFRPDFKFMMYHSLILTNKSAAMSLAYEISDDVMFLYVGILPGPRDPPRVVVAVTFRAYIVQCLIRMNAMWISEKCKVGNDTTRSLVHCRCPSLSNLVASTILRPLVLPAPLHQFVFYRDPVFNLIPFAGMAVIVVLLGCGTLWAHLRDQDKYSHDKVIVLEDNFPGEEWAYLVGVYTGTCWSAGTSSNVGIKIMGDLANSRAHILSSPHYNALHTYSDSWFLIFTTEKLGTIKSIHLWLDYSGISPSWYCRKLIVYDFSGECKYVFRVDTWFYVSVTTDRVEAKVVPVDNERQASLYWLLVDNLIYGFREMHYVLSVFRHHPRSFLTSAEAVASFANSLMFVVAAAAFIIKYDNGGPEDYPFYHFRTADFLFAAFLAIPAIPIATICQFFFKNKVVTDHMKMWNLQPKQQVRVVEKDVTEGKEKDDSSKSSGSPEDVNTKPVLQKISTGKEKYVCQQVPVTINHEFADRLQIIMKRQYIAWAAVTSMFVGLCLVVLTVGHNMAEVKSKICATHLVIALIALPIFTCFNVAAQMFLITIIDKKPCDEPTLACDPRLGTRLEVLGDKQYLDRVLALRSQPQYHTLRTKRLQEIRHEKEKKSFKTALFDTVLSLMVFAMVFSNMQNSWSNDFHLKTNLKTMLSSGVVDTGLKLHKVNDLISLQRYLRDTIGHVNYRRQWYNGEYVEPQGDRFSETGWTVDYTSRLIGVVQLRQKRVKEAYCVPYLLRHLLYDVMCIPSVTPVTESKHNHSMGWQTATDGGGGGSFQSPWRYQTGERYAPSIHYGKSGQWYSSGGYIVSLGRTLRETRAISWKLQESNWVDKRTRVLFIDFCVFNPNVNRISTVSVCIEFRPSGSVFHKMEILTSTVGFQYIEFHTLIWILFGFVFLFMAFRLLILISKHGFTFFWSVWNVLDICIAILFGLNYAVNLTNILHTVFSIQNYLSSSSEGFFPYTWTGYYYSKFILMYFILIIACTVRVFKHFIQTFQVIPVLTTLLSASPHILKICVVVFPMLYIKVNMIQSLLFNAQRSNNRIPLANKVDLSNYSKHFNFPDTKLVPYLHCQFCYSLIFIFSILIIYHYRIAKYNTRIISVTVDVIQHLRDRIRKRRQRNHERLRGGADRAPVSLSSRDTICLLAIQELLQPPTMQNKDSNLKPMKNLVNLKIKKDKAEQASQRKISTVLQNMDSKLDKILNSLKELHDSL